MDDPVSSKSNESGVQMLQQAADKMDESLDDLYKYIFGHIMTQMTATAGIKKQGQAAVDALLQEFCQLDSKNGFEPLDASTLTVSQKQEALPAVNLIREERSGKLKGRTCADGWSQRSKYTKEETASPAVSTDSLMISLMIDAKERHDVATADVEGAYLHADMEDFVLLKLVGEAVNIMCQVNPKYENFVFIENRKKVVYLKLLKALYGCVQSALLWYDLFTNTLVQMGSKLNPYDLCVANSQFKGKQCTVAWYVDNNKISHVDDTVVTNIIEKIEAKFGKMPVTRGKHHVFLAIDITFNDNNGTVTILIKEYLKEAIADSGMDASKVAPTPAKKDLFTVDNGSEQLDKRQGEFFYSIVAKLLYVSKRARTNAQLAIAFLCTRVSCSTEQDWKKLIRLLQYFNGTLDMPLILGADSLAQSKSWVDAAYAVHDDMKIHTGGATSLGCGAIMCKSTKQKLDTKSSAEAEVVGSSDYLPNPIWARMFLAEQGYELTKKIYQDNQSAIRLEKNGQASCRQKSRHINICYFFL